MSPNNRCDYRLFKCIDAAGDTRLMAIVDTKKTIDVHAIAQLVGYYSRSDVSIPPPVVDCYVIYTNAIHFFPIHACH